MTGDPLLEREAELETLAQLVDRLAVGGEGATAVIEGVPGIGKSALLAATMALAQDREGIEVLTAHGAELEHDLTFGAVRELLTPVVALPDGERERVLGGPAALAAPVLGLSAADVSDPLYALYWVVANLAERAPLLVAVDDLHWVDAESLRFLAYLARRIEGLPVLLLATARPREPGAPHGVEVVRDASAIIAPRPLSVAAGGALLGDPGGADEAHRLTGGNPLLLAELARARARAPAGLPFDELNFAEVGRTVMRRVQRISEAAAALVGAVSIFPTGASLADAATVAGLDVPAAGAAADALIDAQVLGASGGELSFAHPLIRGAIYDDLGPFARRRDHAVAARLLMDRGAPVEQIAAHLLAGEPSGDPEHARVLRDAAEAAVAAAAPRAAVRYLRRALDEGGAEPELLVELGRLQRLTGHTDAQATLIAGFAAAEGSAHRARAAIELAATAFVNADHGTVAGTHAAMSDAELVPDDRLVLDMLLAESLWAEGDFQASVRLIESVPHGLPGDTAAQRMALGMTAAVHCLRCAPAEEVIDMLRRCLGEDGVASSPVAGIDVGDPLQWLVQTGALDEAEALAGERMDHARATGDEALFAATQNAAGWLLALRGDLAGSIASYRLGLAQPALSPFMRSHIVMNLVETLIWCGDLDAATAELDAEPRGVGHIEQLRAARRAEITHWRGDHAAALPGLAEIYELSLAAGSLNPNTMPLTGDYCDALAGAGRRDEAVTLAEEMVRRSDHVGALYARGLFRGALGRVSGDLAVLEEALAIFTDSPYRWHEARARLDLGTALRRERRRVDAREHLRLALDYAERHGARILAERAREELRLAGARPRRAVLTGADSLTPAEARIARLAAEGRSNKEIAQHLFLTVKTVEMNLVRAYRKLDIKSRRDLPAALAA